MTSAEETGDFTGYKDKEPTDLQTRYTVWLKDKLELTFGTKKEEAAFDEGVRLSVALRMAFQRSPENQAESTMVKANRGKAEAAPAKAAPAKATKATKATPAKKAAKAAAPPAPEPEEAAEVEETPAAAPAARRTGRPAARRTRAAATTASAPF